MTIWVEHPVWTDGQDKHTAFHVGNISTGGSMLNIQTNWLLVDTGGHVIAGVSITGTCDSRGVCHKELYTEAPQQTPCLLNLMIMQ